VMAREEEEKEGDNGGGTDPVTGSVPILFTSIINYVTIYTYDQHQSVAILHKHWFIMDM